MKSTMKMTNVKSKQNSVELNTEVMEVSNNVENYCEIYRELAELIGENNSKKIWNYYRGLSIQFPQRLYSKEYTKKYIKENIDNMKLKDIAKHLNLTERRVRQIAKETKED